MENRIPPPIEAAAQELEPRHGLEISELEQIFADIPPIEGSHASRKEIIVELGQNKLARIRKVANLHLGQETDWQYVVDLAMPYAPERLPEVVVVYSFAWIVPNTLIKEPVILAQPGTLMEYAIFSQDELKSLPESADIFHTKSRSRGKLKDIPDITPSIMTVEGMEELVKQVESRGTKSND